jgi:hypothetical protein
LPELTSYDWWLIGMAVDEALTQNTTVYPPRPIVAHLRALLPKVRDHQAAADLREAPDRAQAELLDDSPF